MNNRVNSTNDKQAVELKQFESKQYEVEARWLQGPFGNSNQDNHLLVFLRSGEKNFFQQPRSNLQLIGYRITKEENPEQQRTGDDNEQSPGNISLWRDYWRPTDTAQQQNIKSRRLLDHIKNVRFRYLPPNVDSVTDEAWVNVWPESTDQKSLLPAAVEITLDIMAVPCK